MLVDAHCHLGAGAFDEDRDAVLGRARAAGVGHVLVIGETVAASQAALTLARATPGLSATAGLHPHEAKHWSPETERALRALLAQPEVVAVGETGLDYHYDHSPRDAQRAAFEAQLGLGVELQRPVVIHARAADDEMAADVRAWGGRTPLILHSFSSGPAVWRAGLAAGAYFSFSGMITFKNWRWVDAPTAIPADRLLVETDAPYLAPVPHRGGRNEPAFVRHVAAALAAARGDDPAALEAQLGANARRLFGPRLETVLEAGS